MLSEFLATVVWCSGSRMEDTVNRYGQCILMIETEAVGHQVKGFSVTPISLHRKTRRTNYLLKFWHRFWTRRNLWNEAGDVWKKAELIGILETPFGKPRKWNMELRICTFLVCVTNFARNNMQLLSFTSIFKLRYKQPRIIRVLDSS